eukprot:289832-Prymnesium_polylepis.1
MPPACQFPPPGVYAVLQLRIELSSSSTIPAVINTPPATRDTESAVHSLTDDSRSVTEPPSTRMPPAIHETEDAPGKIVQLMMLLCRRLTKPEVNIPPAFAYLCWRPLFSVIEFTSKVAPEYT